MVVRQLRDAGPGAVRNDLGAGVVLSALLIPAGMAYAQAAGLPPISGLYATIVPLVVYALVGPSRILVFGPDSSLAPIIAGAVVPLAGGDPDRAVAIAGMVSLLAGALCLVAAVARFGFLADLLSLPVRYGYINGIALTVLVSQLPKLLGFAGGGEGLGDNIAATWRGVREGRVNGWALAVGVTALAIMIIGRRIAPRVPMTLVGLAVTAGWTAAGRLQDRGVGVLGTLPRGFPRPAWPGVAWTDMPQLVGAAAGVAVVAFADTSVLSRTYSLRTRHPVDPDRELAALGVVNAMSGLFQGFAVSSSQSRTPVAESAGARTQLTGLVGAVVVGVLVLAAPGAFRSVPTAALSAVVISASLRLVDLRGVARLARVRRSEFILSVAAFAAVSALGPITGIAVAVGLSLLNFMRRAWRPHTTELVRVDGLKGYHDAQRHPEGRRIPGLLLYRFDGPLFFANGGYFEQDVLQAVDRSAIPIRRVVVTAEPITDVDTTAAEAFAGLLDELDRRGIQLGIAELKGPVRERLVAYGLAERIDGRFWRTTGEAVHAYVRDTGVDYRDWETRKHTGGAPSET